MDAQQSSSDSTEDSNILFENDSSGCSETYCEHEKKIIEFGDKEIIRGQCVQHFPWKCVSFGSMDTATGKLYHLSEWTIENQDDAQDECDQTVILEEIKSIREEFEQLTELKTPYLINYINMKHIVESSTRITVYLLTDFVLGSNCNDLYLYREVPVETAMLRKICKSILKALEFLHQRNIVHKQVSPRSIYICNNGSIQLANAALNQRLTDIVLYDMNSGNYSTSGDIYDFGVAVLSLQLGHELYDNFIPEKMDSDIKAFLEQSISENPTSASILLQHSFIKHSQPLAVNECGLYNEPALDKESHLKSNFEVLRMIGKGGFGQVDEVRNKLNGRKYALKRIKLSSNALKINKIKREVCLLSALDHENIVKYCHSWTAPSEPDDKTLEASSYDGDAEYESDEEDNNPDLETSGTMYILMELCGEETLRSAIDNNLYINTEKVWRYFREILEGLAYIHKQKIIHRDLKPANIFLNSSDHIKIGDFGLATMSRRTKSSLFNLSVSFDDICSGGDSSSLTGHVGTTYYMAPECWTSEGKYDQKVDLYSLGIIFFEMSYLPCTTGMERHSNLSKLRFKEINFPDNADMISKEQREIISALLSHDSTKRPLARELLESQKLPPPIPKERDLKNILRHTLDKTDSKNYKYLVKSCLSQQGTVEQDVQYDKNVKAYFSIRRLKFFKEVKNLLVQLFHSFKAVELNTPITMPKQKCYENYDIVKLMTNSGGIVTLPYDLRIPFIRFVALNGIKSIRRYSIAKIYREKQAFGHIPKEMYECAFDIVISENERNPKAYTYRKLISSTKVIYVLHKLAVMMQSWHKTTLLIRLNHINLLKAILLHCGIKEKHSEYIRFMADLRRNKITPRNYPNSSSFDQAKIAKTEKYLRNEVPIAAVRNILRNITKRNTEAKKLVDSAISELQSIIEKSEHFGVTTKIVINLGLLYGTPQYSGMICQLVYSAERNNKPINEVIAVGGCYDELLQTYKRMLGQAGPPQFGVGVSIYLEKLNIIYSQYANKCLALRIAKTFVLQSSNSCVSIENMEDEDDESDDFDEDDDKYRLYLYP